VRIAGGGTHPFHQWNDRRIFPGERFQQLHARYGYLAKLFTVFGQHIHLGCENADQAIYLTHAFTRYLPQFIALSAASPFYQGADSAFDSSRLSVVNAFPLSGVMPYVRDWSEFGAYYQKMERLGIVQSMKAFYWDVRPKPEYGTVEIRVCDTPLTVEKAAVIAAYARVLADYLIAHEQRDPEIYAVHAFNRFQACRYGYKGMVVDTHDGIRRAIGEDILQTLDRIAPHARPGDVTALMTLRDWITAAQNDAGWLRAIYQKTGAFEDTVRLQSDRWMSPQPLRQGGLS